MARGREPPGQGPSGRCLAVLPGAPPASPHLTKNGFEELRRGTSLSRRAGGESQERLSGWVTKYVGQGERSSGWPTGCRLVASSFRGFDRGHLADESPTCRRGHNRRWPPREGGSRWKGFWFWGRSEPGRCRGTAHWMSSYGASSTSTKVSRVSWGRQKNWFAAS